MPDPQYVVARSVLLDALEALGDQRAAVIVVGAQAIYLHTGAIELAVGGDVTFAAGPAMLAVKPEDVAVGPAPGFEHRLRARLEELTVAPVADPQTVVQIRQLASEVYLDDKIRQYIVAIGRATRNTDQEFFASYLDYHQPASIS